MPPGDEQRQDPFASMGDEPVDDLATVIPSALRRPPSIGGRRTPLRPSERRRKKRMLTVTFSNVHPDIPDRIRGLAEKWGMFTAAGRPNHSAVVERLLLPQLEAAERGEIAPPSLADEQEPDPVIPGEQWL